MALLRVQLYISWRSLDDVTWRVEQCVRTRGLSGAHIIPSLSFYLGAPATMLASNAGMKKLNRTSVQNDLLCSNICLSFRYFTEDTWVKQGSLKDTFYINHCQGNLPVLYNARGWLKVAREHAAVKQAHPILAESSK